MAYLINSSSGTFSTMTWNVIDPNTFTDNRTNGQSTSTTFIGFGFTASGMTVSAVGFNFSGKNTVAGNVIVQLIAGRTINPATPTILASMSCDLATVPAITTLTNGWSGWTFFKLNSITALTNNTSYAFRIRTDSTAQIRLNSAAATGNVNCAIVTTATASLLVNDTIFISGLITSTGSLVERIVNMDNTGTQSYGTVNATSSFGLYITSDGTLKYPRTSPVAITYSLRIGANVLIGASSSLDMGTTASGDSITSPVKAIFEIGTLSATYGLTSSGTIFTAGDFKTPGVTLNGDVNVGATSISVTSAPTNWLSNDLVYLTGTNRTSTTVFNDDERVISSISGTTINLRTGLSFSHAGSTTSYVQGHIVNLTRNVVINAPSERPLQRVSIASNFGSMFMYNTELPNIRIVLPTAANFVMDGCSMYLVDVGNFTAPTNVNQSAIWNTAATTSINNSIFYKHTFTFNTINSTPQAMVIDDYNYILRILISPYGATGCGSYNVFSSNVIGGIYGGFKEGATDNIFYNIDNALMLRPAIVDTQWYNFKIWRCNRAISFLEAFTTAGFSIYARRTGMFIMNNFRIFSILSSVGGSPNAIVGVLRGEFLSYSAQAPNTLLFKLMFKESYIYGGTPSTTTTRAIVDFPPNNVSANYPMEAIYYQNCIFGKDDLGNSSPFSVAAIVGNNAQNIIFTNCDFTAVSNMFATQSVRSESSYMANGIVSVNHNQIPGEYRVYQRSGVISNDTTYNGMRLTPHLSNKLISNTIRIPVKPSDGLCNISVSIRRSATPTDVSNYNGNPVRLMMMLNPLANGTASSFFITDVVCATSSSATPSGTWEILSYTLPAPVANNSVLEFYIDCDCLTFPDGFVTIKDWMILNGNNQPINNDTRLDGYSSSEGQYTYPTYLADGSSYGFFI